MSIFSAIKQAIFGDKGPLGGQFSGRKDEPTAPAAPAPVARPAPSPQPPSPQPASPQAAPRPAPPAAPDATSAPAAPAPAATSAQLVDVEAVLSARPGADRLDWRHSIVDLLKLLELDSSLAARKQLADELNVHAAADGSAEENIALHKAVMRALAENGGNVPAGLLT